MVFFGKPEEGFRLAYVDVDVQIIPGLILEYGKSGVDWNHLAQEREKWRAWVDVVVNVFV